MTVILKEFFEKVNFEVSRRQQKHENFPACIELIIAELKSNEEGNDQESIQPLSC